MHEKPSQLELIRFNSKDYNWKNFPERVDLVAIYKIRPDRTLVFARQKPWTDDSFLSLLMTVARDSVEVTIESVQLKQPVREGNINQAILYLVALSYGVVKYPSMISLQDIPIKELTEAILKLDEYKDRHTGEIKEKRITPTMIELMRYAKDSKVKDFTFDGLRDVLAPIYSFHMRDGDVLRVLLKNYLQMAQIHEFEISHRFNVTDLIEHLILSPINAVSNYPKRITFDDNMTVKHFYSKMLECMLNEIMFSRIDWCRSIVYPEEITSDKNAT